MDAAIYKSIHFVAKEKLQTVVVVVVEVIGKEG